jgi:2-amino-4-hydroxy-6-hydroxymethyldihydropteridine diphosphokinase
MLAAVGLGSNLGDRESNLDYAVEQLASVLRGLRVSRYRETAPVGVAGDQPPFLNAAAIGEATLPPRKLLETLLQIERRRGRERPYPNAPRTIDLDLLLYGDDRIDEPGLTVPHPRFRERRFVLEPLVEIAPDLVDPVTGKTVVALLHLVTG